MTHESSPRARPFVDLDLNHERGITMSVGPTHQTLTS